MTHRMTRRAALGATAALPFASGLFGLGAMPASAAAPVQGGSTPTHNRFMLGDLEVTALLAGTRTVPEPHGIFGTNVDDETFAEVSRNAFIPTDAAQFFFTPTLVNTGSELILFDTGLNAGGITNALTAAGYSPDQIDKVVLTHMHGDHIGGLMNDGAPTFANATFHAHEAEFEHWDMSGNEGFEGNVRPLADRMSFLTDGSEVASGISAMNAFGHTPGHTAFVLDGGGDKQLLIGADFANHYVWSLAHPDWEVRFDMDKSAAAATRRKLLTMLAAERMPFIGYHMPFPAMGFVDTQDDGFHYVPASYQMMLTQQG